MRKQPRPADLDELLLQVEQQRSQDSEIRSAAHSQAHNAPVADPTNGHSVWIAEAGLFFVMGMSGWWTANATYAETPILVSGTPEKQGIGNLLGVATQIGNVFPFLYKMLSKQRQVELLGRSILACQFAAIAAALLTGSLWSVTIGQHSVWLVLCMIVSGGVGSLSNVTYWALASRYDGVHCTKAMSVGSTVGGLVSAGMAMAQEAGHDPRFSLSKFMVLVALVQAGFLLAFLVVLKSDPAASESSNASLAAKPSNTVDESNDTSLMRLPSRSGLAVDIDLDDNADLDQPLVPEKLGQRDGISSLLKKAILVTMFAIYAQTYSLQTLQPFMVQSYAATCDAVFDGSEDGDLEDDTCSCVLNEDHTNCIISEVDCVGNSCQLSAPSGGGPSDDDLLRYIYLMQQFGDVTGRMATAIPYKPSNSVVLVLIGFIFVVSVVFITAALASTLVATVLPGNWAMVLPLLFFLYYFTRGYVVTVLYVVVKEQSVTQKEAESMSGNMGLCGQIGAMLANAALFIAVQLLW